MVESVILWGGCVQTLRVLRYAGDGSGVAFVLMRLRDGDEKIGRSAILPTGLLSKAFINIAKLHGYDKYFF